MWTATVLAAASLLNLLADLIAPNARASVVLVAGLLLTAITLTGAGRSTRMAAGFTLLKLVVLAGVAIGGLSSIPHPAVPAAAPVRPFAALVMLFFAFVGFERATAVVGEVRDP